MLSNIDLIQWAKKLKIPNFRGVFSRDTLPAQKMHGSFIINMEPEKDDRGNFNEGSHWVALYIDHNMNPFYFDSFGFSPPENVKTYCRGLKSPISYSNKEIQDIKSKCCGYYALYFCLWMSKHEILKPTIKKYQLFVNQFSINPAENEARLFSLLGIRK